MFGRVDKELVPLLDGFVGQGVNDSDPFNLITPEFDPHRKFLIGGTDFDRVAADSEVSPVAGDIVSFIKHIDEPFEHRITVKF